DTPGGLNCDYSTRYFLCTLAAHAQDQRVFCCVRSVVRCAGGPSYLSPRTQSIHDAAARSRRSAAECHDPVVERACEAALDDMVERVRVLAGSRLNGALGSSSRRKPDRDAAAMGRRYAIASYNVTLLATFPLSALAAQWLAWTIVRRR